MNNKWNRRELLAGVAGAGMLGCSGPQAGKEEKQQAAEKAKTKWNSMSDEQRAQAKNRAIERRKSYSDEENKSI